MLRALVRTSASTRTAVACGRLHAYGQRTAAPLRAAPLGAASAYASAAAAARSAALGVAGPASRVDVPRPYSAPAAPGAEAKGSPRPSRPPVKADVSMKGKRALVCGIADDRSIALGIARCLAAAGAEVAVTYKPDPKGRFKEKVAAACAANGVQPALLLPLDVADAASVEALFAEIGSRWGALDTLVHSIAFAPAEDLSAHFIDVTEKGWAVAMHVSAESLQILCHAAMPLFKSAGGGSVITVSYLGAERVVPGYNLMGVAKAALEASVRYLAYDMGTAGVTINAISCGPIATLAGAHCPAMQGEHALPETYKERSPLHRCVTQEEVGGVALFLASPLGSGLTGQTLHVDAGFSIMV